MTKANNQSWDDPSKPADSLEVNHRSEGEHPGDEDLAMLMYDEVAVADRRQLESHLAKCARCNAVLDEWQRATEQLDRWDHAALAVAVASRHRPQRLQPLATGRGRLWPVAVATCAALLIGLAIGRATTAPPASLSPAEVRQLAEHAAQEAMERGTAAAIDRHWREVGYQEIRNLAGAIAVDVWDMALAVRRENRQLRAEVEVLQDQQLAVESQLRHLLEAIALQATGPWRETSSEEFEAFEQEHSKIFGIYPTTY